MGGSVNIHIGGYPNNNYNNYGYGYGYNNNYYNVKRAARNSISQSTKYLLDKRYSLVIGMIPTRLG